MNRDNRYLRMSLYLLVILFVCSGLAGISALAVDLDPHSIPKYEMPLIIPPAMPRSKPHKILYRRAKNADYYEIAVRQFEQQVLPPEFAKTTVWSYGSINQPGTVEEGGTFNFPAFTIEAKWKQPVRVKWINDLVDDEGNYLPHLFPVDQTLHWANPGGLIDTRGTDPTPYTGPVPMITHVHGAHTTEESDGYPEAWYLPAANNLTGYMTHGTLYNQFKAESAARIGTEWEAGTATFQYANDQRATTLWYHDHTLGMTRLNVYAGPAGFYILRGGPDDAVQGVLPGPAPALGDPAGVKYYEIPIVIQDRSFHTDGRLAYPDNRAFFEGLAPEKLQIPFIPGEACSGDQSDVSPIWNPEFFGNTMVVNGRTWPYLEVEARRYRLRYLNGCQSRFLLLSHDNGLVFWQIGAEGGFLPSPIQLNRLLIAPAERADVIVDFTGLEGTTIILKNTAPDEPFGGGEPDSDFDVADPETTGQVMQFRVIAATSEDLSTPPDQLILPPLIPLGAVVGTRKITLNEEESKTVRASEDDQGNVVSDCDEGSPFGPTSALLGTLGDDGVSSPMLWMDTVTETPTVGATEVWEIYNFTADAHPIHIHLVQFQVVNRQQLEVDEEGMATQPAELVEDTVREPEPWERGYKDTVVVYPGEVARVKARFDIPGLFVWHCHILEHEDNEMMRPYRVVLP